MRIKALSKTLVLSFLAAASPSLQTAEIDQGIPEYERTSGVYGNITSLGSDTRPKVMTHWAEDFKRV